MPVVTPADFREFAMHGVTFRSYVASASGSRELASWRADFAPRTPGAPHRMDREEVLLVLSGELSVTIDGQTTTCPAGTAVLVPANALFCVDNDSGSPAAAWVTTTLGMTAQVEGEAARITPPWAQ